MGFREYINIKECNEKFKYYKMLESEVITSDKKLNE